MPDSAAHRLLARLAPHGEPGRSLCDGVELAGVADALGQGPAGWAVDFSRRCFDTVVAQVGNERPPEFFTTLARAIERSSCELLLVLDGHESRSRLNSDQVAIVEILAREDVPFARIVSGLRIIQREWTQVLLDQIEAHRPSRERLPLLRETTESVTAFFDRTIDAVIAEHLNERQRLMAQRISSQRDVVAAIMAGRPVDPVVAQAVLGVDLDQHHMAFLVWHDDPDLLGGAAHSYLGRIARTVCGALRCPAPVAANTDATTLRAWASRARPFGDGDVAVLREMRWERGVRIVVGPPGAGIAGYRRSHLAAEDAYRLTRSVPVGPAVGSPVTAHRDVALTALLATDLERARWFVGEELGRLAADDEGTADLRTTLLSFLDHGGSLVRAAAALHVHRNTVVYRLRRAEKLLGHAISERVLETHAALRPATVLSRPTTGSAELP